MSWLATIVKHVDYLRDRYAAFPVRDDATRAGALQVLDEVRRKELRRVHGRGALESAAFVDADVRYDLYAVKDTEKDRVVGCIRVTAADQIAPIPESRQEYLLDRFPPELLKRTQIFTRLVMLPAYRKTAASLVLFRRLCEDGMAGDTLAALLSCEPGLYAGYLRLGFRPLGGVHQGASGRIPDPDGHDSPRRGAPSPRPLAAGRAGGSRQASPAAGSDPVVPGARGTPRGPSIRASPSTPPTRHRTSTLSSPGV